MDKVEVYITENIEQVTVEVTEVHEQIDVHVQEKILGAVNVTEIKQSVEVYVTEKKEEVTVQIREGGIGEGGVATIPYKVWTMPGIVDPTYGITAYTGFAEDLDADPSEAKWSVKRVREDETTAWAGFQTFDEILDDYLTLTYT